MKRQVTDLEKIFANHISDNGFIPKIYNELSKFNIKIQIVQLEMGQKI